MLKSTVNQSSRMSWPSLRSFRCEFVQAPVRSASWGLGLGRCCCRCPSPLARKRDVKPRAASPERPGRATAGSRLRKAGEKIWSMGDHHSGRKNQADSIRAGAMGLAVASACHHCLDEAAFYIFILGRASRPTGCCRPLQKPKKRSQKRAGYPCD